MKSDAHPRHAGERGSGIVVSYDDTPVMALVLDVADGVVQTIHLVANPDKLLGVRSLGAF